MKIVFAGTPAFAVPSLKALIDQGHQVLAVYTQPDRPAGRGRKPHISPVKACAHEYGLAIAQPDNLEDQATVDQLQSLAPALMVVIAYGLILPPAVLAIPTHGCINVHASLLPRWRGAAPIQRAIEAGDTRTGISIMRMEAGLDTGPIYLQEEVPIDTDDTAGSLHDKLAAVGARCLTKTIELLAAGQARAVPQNENGVSYAAKLTKAEARLDWRASAERLARQVRAYNPWPIAFSQWNHRRLRIWSAVAADQPAGASASPGTVLSSDKTGITVQCGEGALVLTRLQIEGGQPLPAGDFLNGHPIHKGEVLGQT